MDSPSKQKKKQMVILFGGLSFVIALMVFGMWMSDPNKGKPSPIEVASKKASEVKKDYSVSSSTSVSAQETWISKSEKELQELRSEQKQMKDMLQQLINNNKSKAANDIGASPVFDSSLDNTGEGGVSLDAPIRVPPKPTVNANGSPLQNATRRAVDGSLPPVPESRNNNSSEEGEESSGSIVVVSLSDDTEGGEKKSKNVSHYLPTGSFATAVLLSGVDAPTGGSSSSNPIPVLMRVMDAGQLPNYFNSDIDKCHVTGAAHGDISSERAKIRLEMLTCILTNGDIIEEKVKGYVSGEDGKEGLRGKLVSKQGSLIARSLLAGIAGGMGSSLSQQYQQVSTSALGSITSVDPNKTAQAGLATGTSNALEKIADYYIARANETYPIIEVDANRIGEIILTGGTDMKRTLIGNTRGE